MECEVCEGLGEIIEGDMYIMCNRCNGSGMGLNK